MTSSSAAAKLLVPLDGSEVGESALPWARYLALSEGKEVELLRCFPPLSAVYAYPEFSVPPPVAYDLSGLTQYSEGYLKKAASEYGLEGVSYVVLEGLAAQTILDESENADIDSILLSSHGQSGVGRWLVGSVVNKVVRGAHKPVYVFKAHDLGDTYHFRRVLVCVDGSPVSEHAFEAGLKLCRTHGAVMHLFRAVEPPHHGYGFPVEPETEAELLKAARDYVDELASRCHDLPVETSVQRVSPAEGILSLEDDFDLIVLAGHGHGGVRRWLLGSVTEKILHRCSSPLLIIPAST